MRKKLTKLLLVAVFFLVSFQIDNHFTKAEQEQKELLVYTGAHYPSGYKGFTNQYYYWFYGYGPAGSCGKPSFYDVNTGKLLHLSKFDWHHMDIFGRFIVLRSASVPETFKEYEKTYVYFGAKLLLILKEELLYINEQKWFAQGKNGLSIYSSKTNKNIGNYPLNPNQYCFLINNKNYPAFAVIDYSKETTKIVSFTGFKTLLSLPFVIPPYLLEQEVIRMICKGLMYEVDLSTYKITRLLETPIESVDNNVISAERALNSDKNTLIDIKTGKVLVSIKGDVSFKGLIGDKLIYCDYKATDLRCYSSQDGKLLWQLKGKGFSGLFAYGNRLLGTTKESDLFICLDIKTGKTIWAKNNLGINYFYSHFDKSLCYYCEPMKTRSDRYVFNSINLDNGNILWSRILKGREVSEVDFVNNRYYIQENYSTVRCFELKTHKQIW